MAHKVTLWLRTGAVVALAFVGIDTNAQQFMPPGSYSGHAANPNAVVPAEAGAPALTPHS